MITRTVSSTLLAALSVLLYVTPASGAQAACDTQCVASLRATVATQRETIRTQSATIADLTQRTRELRRRIRDLQKQVQKLRAERARMRDALSDAAAQQLPLMDTAGMWNLIREIYGHFPYAGGCGYGKSYYAGSGYSNYDFYWMSCY